MENWKPIPNFLGYECSDLGRIRSFKKQGKGGFTNIPHILKPGDRPNGYKFVSLSKGGKPHLISIHTIVMTTFVGPKPKGLEIAHNNGIKADNRLENLRYCTRIENEMDKIKHGTSKVQFKLNEDAVRELRKLCAEAGIGNRFKILREFASNFGMSATSVYEAAKGITWKHITDPPPAF